MKGGITVGRATSKDAQLITFTKNVDLSWFVAGSLKPNVLFEDSVDVNSERLRLELPRQIDCRVQTLRLTGSLGEISKVVPRDESLDRGT